MTTPEQLQMIGVHEVLAAATRPQNSFRDHAEDALSELIASGEIFTADDIRDRIPDGIEPHHPNVLPALLRVSARRGVIVAVGWTRSTRRERHASVNRMWRRAV